MGPSVSDSATPRVPPIRLCLVISSLGSGGAERVMTIMASYWAAHGHPTTLLTFARPDEPSFFPLDDRVLAKSLSLNRPASNVAAGIWANVGRIRALRRAIRASDPDVVISFMDRTNVLVLTSTIGLRIPVVVEEHNDPHEERMAPAWGMLRGVLYRRAARVVALSDDALGYFSPAIRRRGRVIPNPVILPSGSGSPGGQAHTDRGPTVLAMGRLVPQKGFDLLLEAFALLDPRRRGLSLRIVGEGPTRPELEAMRDRLDLTGVVEFPGVLPDPRAAMDVATVFVLSSRYEGFPTVLGEAMAVGLPVVAFDCPSGPRQMIRPEVDGILVPREDVAALAAAMDRVLRDDELRTRLATNAPEILDRFGLATIMGRWETLIDTVVTPRSAA